MDKSLFWADQLAGKIVKRKRFRYVSKPVPKLKRFTVKTSASLSGVLHIGRLSDTIRSESVCRALKDAGVNTRLIWVAEDMDPLRKVPAGVPASYKKYIGMPVTDIPDPKSCHKSYADHHVSAYFEVIDRFVSSRMQKYSMRKEYKSGAFKPYIKKIVENIEKVVEIQNKYRSNPLEKGWSPWQPICENCGKIITPRVTKFEGGIAHYECRDYSFEKTKAEGCGHKGQNDPLKGNGKLMWKSEWASQWCHWQVVSEGAGLEYQVPMSAWWVNAEIVEKVLDFPMPEPIFYGHLLIDGEKMSASRGNVVYPKDWLKVARPELLRFFYNKKLTKMRSFSWKELPKVYDDFDLHSQVYWGGKRLENKKEEAHMKRLYEISGLRTLQKVVDVPFDFAAVVAQVSVNRPSRGIEILKKSGHIKGRLSKQSEYEVRERLSLAFNWVNEYAPEFKFEVNKQVPKNIKSKLDKKQVNALKELGILLKGKVTQDSLYNSFWDISKKNGIPPKDFFRAAYLAILGKESGPKLAPLIMALGKDDISRLLELI